MAAIGPVSGATFVDDATLGTISLANPGNALASDNSYVTWVLLLGQLGHYLKVTGFGLTIPADSVILGIQVDIEKSTTVGTSMTDQSVKIVQGGVIGGTELASASQWGTSDAYATYGSATALWGLTWTPADVNLSTFGVAIAPTCGLAATAQVDHVRVTVSYQGNNRPSSNDRRFQSSGLRTVERAS